MSTSENKQNNIYFAACSIFFAIFAFMSVYRYYCINSTYFDLGIYENIIYRVAFHQEWYLLFSGHVYPILLVHSFIYKILPFTETLLILQALTVSIGSYPLYLVARKKLKGNYPIIVILSYFLYFGVEYNIVFDFHPDHIIIPIMFFAFYFLENNKMLNFVITCLIGMTIKEPFNLVIMMLGLYALIKYKKKKEGLFIAASALILFLVEYKIIIPYFSPVIAGIQNSQAIKFGESLLGMIVNILINPHIWLPMIFNKAVLFFIFCVFAPLLCIPLLAPLEMLIALPMFIMLFSTGSSLHVGIANHYLACIIPSLFIAFIYGLDKVTNYKYFASIQLGTAILFNIILSPSPVSQTFLRGRSLNFSYKSYISGPRESMIKENISKYIPSDPKISVVSQNSLFISYFAKRNLYHSFPQNISSCDYVILDIKRPLFVIDIVNEREYFKNFNIVKKTRPIIYENDGFYIFGKVLSSKG